MRLREVLVEHSGNTTGLLGCVERRSGERFDLYFAFSGSLPGPMEATADAFIPALLIPAMLSGEALECDLPVSPMLLSSLPRAQAILSSWYPRFRRVDLRIGSRSPEPPRAPCRGDAVGTFFSAGVDSFYTLLKHQRAPGPGDRVSHLVFMKGFDSQLSKGERLPESELHVRGIARRLGLEVIVGESNVRDHLRELWPEAYQGAALGAAGLALGGGFRQVLIPASLTWGSLIPWGSHPLLDECWSTERVEFLHDGCEAFRHDKIRAIAGWDPAALDELRVCLSARGGPVNCGRCTKCVRTMAMLALVGRLGARSFPATLPPDYVAILERDWPGFRRELLQSFARGMPETGLPGLRRALERIERATKWRRTLRSLAQLSGMLPALHTTRRVARRLGPSRRTGAPALVRGSVS